MIHFQINNNIKFVEDNSEEKHENISVISYEDVKPPTKRITNLNREEVKTYLDFSSNTKESQNKPLNVRTNGISNTLKNDKNNK